MNDYAIGIDIGGTKTLAGLVDSNGRLVRQVQFPTSPDKGSGYVIDRLRQTSAELMEEAKAGGGGVRGIGIASAGLVDSKRTTIVYAGNLGWRDVPIGSELESPLGIPVRLGNDANLAAVAEYVWGTNKEVPDLIYITVSTGVGAGIISGGRLVSGASDSAGEFGHISVDPNGPRCGCGNYGCLENYSSGTAIAALAGECLPPHPGGAWTSKDVIEAAESGNAAAADLLRTAGIRLGIGITTLIHLFNPTRIVMGGGVMNGGDLLMEHVESTIDERCIPGMRRQAEIRRTGLGSEIGVLGAAGLFFMDPA